MLLRNTAKERDGKFVDVCLVDALRAHGFKVPYTKDGPFWAIADGSCFLSPWQCHGGKSFCLVLPNNSEKIQSMARFKVKVLGSGMPRNDVPYMCCCLVI